jgi:hypothetical protein
MSQFPVDRRLLSKSAALPLTQLADRVGQTPFYAYERKLAGPTGDAATAGAAACY